MPLKSQHHLGDDVLLDLVRAAIDRHFAVVEVGGRERRSIIGTDRLLVPALLERFALEVAGGDADDAAAALAASEKTRDGDLGSAAALARLAWSGGATDANAARAASVHLARLGPEALRLATAEQFRMARDGSDTEEIVRSSRRWYDAGGGLPAARLVVADPPRAGLDRQVVEYLCRDGAGAERFAYVSCDPATLARDIGLLRARGWELADLRAFDAFPMTHHVECVATLVRG